MLASTYTFWLFVHLVGVFGFLLAHGASAAIGFRLRREHNLDRLRALLELSSSTLNVFYGSFALLLVGGIAAGFVGHWWGQGWIWTALAVLIAMSGAMYGLASSYYNRVREAAGMQTYDMSRKGIPAKEPAPTAELAANLDSPRPMVIAAVGAIGLLFILWLMVYKPF